MSRFFTHYTIHSTGFPFFACTFPHFNPTNKADFKLLCIKTCKKTDRMYYVIKYRSAAQGISRTRRFWACLKITTWCVSFHLLVASIQTAMTPGSWYNGDGESI